MTYTSNTMFQKWQSVTSEARSWMALQSLESVTPSGGSQLPCHEDPQAAQKEFRAKNWCLLQTTRVSFLDALMLHLGNKSMSPSERLQMIEASADTWIPGL